MDRTLLYTLSFFTNAAILVFEIAGGRLLAPYLGTSVGVWAGLIAVILGGMAIGYHFGGKFADEDASEKRIGIALFLSGSAALLAWGVRDFIPTWVLYSHLEPTLGALIAGTCLFMPTVILLAAVSPMLAKNLIQKLDTAGKSVGELNAVGTAGSIAGAIGAGMVLVPLFGVGSIMLGVSGCLLVASFFLLKNEAGKFLGIAGLVAVLAFGINTLPTFAKTVAADVSTAYNRIFITHEKFEGKTLALWTSPFGIQCLMYEKPDGSVDETRLAADYQWAHEAVIAATFPDGPRRMLFLGGCVESFPRYLLLKYPNASADVVEIDPGMTKVAEKYFGFNPAKFPTLKMIYEDARIFANGKHDAYDVEFMDAFDASGRPPFQLLTKEMFQRLSANLSDDGVLLINTHGSYRGEGELFASVFVKTAREVFPHAELYQYTNKPDENQNLVIVVSKTRELPDTFTNDIYPGFTVKKTPIDENVIAITDDYAPVEGIFRSALRPQK